MDLPKGIVVNSPGLSGDVERINEEPVASETIAHFWKVYTTTQRTLRDPTAERLENYWWRIWGSRQRELRGATVAQLFLYISDGHTFNGRPLLSKVNRFEGHPTPPRIQNVDDESGDALAEISNTLNPRPSPSSRGKQKHPHPILKKSRGPSNTGPRPTARFVSPHESEDDEATGEVGQNDHVKVRPPTPEIKSEQGSQNLLKVPPVSTNKKKGKGHVVAAVAGRRRPAIVRRKSSQSGGDDQEPREKMEKRPTSRDKQTTVLNSRESENSPKKGSSSGINQPPRSVGSKSTNSDSAGPGPATMKANENARLISQTKGALNESELNEEEIEELEVQRLILAEANARMKREHPSSETSQVLRQNLRSMSLSNLRLAGEPADVKGKASIAPIKYADATGEINLCMSIPTEIQQNDKGKGRDLSLRFPKRTMPNNVARNYSVDRLVSPPMSKSQSQLSLLLQGRPRTNGQNNKEKGKEKQIETGSEDTQDEEGLEMPPREKKKR